MELTKDILTQLGQPFPEDEIEFLPRAQSNGKALGLAYIDARTVMNRLDAVVGPENWAFDFDVLADSGKLVRGRLTVCGVTKCDAGEAATEEELLKSAVSDAIKRAGVHFGIGRYLYYLPRVWAPYDAQKRRFTEPPRLEAAAVEKALRLAGITPDRTLQTTPVQPRPSAQAPRPSPRVEQAVKANEQGNAYAYETGVRQATPPKQEAEDLQLAPPAANGALACQWDGCGVSITAGQASFSERKFGHRLCSAHQREAQERA